ncbi:MAG: DNA adenine methylase [Pseudomonadota bacterium]|nr:DNA adenine methylase [Pseudomonadota bacterium]
MELVQTGKIPSPKPFVKWAGGKRQLVNLLRCHSPSSFNCYVEPFVGGGAFLFSMLPEKAVISDVNPELINAYKVIRDDVEKLIRSLKRHRNEESYFYKVRAKHPVTMSTVQRASRFIFLNKTCFNGLYRENSKGQFNVPFGRYVNPNTVDEENLRAVSAYLNRAQLQILHQDYQQTVSNAQKGDFVYFDPPYYPISATASFTRYAKNDFNARNQEELAQAFHDLAGRGCQAMLSNSNTDFIKKLYREFSIIEIEATRFINCKAERRGKELVEILVKSY